MQRPLELTLRLDILPEHVGAEAGAERNRRILRRERGRRRKRGERVRVAAIFERPRSCLDEFDRIGRLG